MRTRPDASVSPTGVWALPMTMTRFGIDSKVSCQTTRRNDDPAVSRSSTTMTTGAFADNAAIHGATCRRKSSSGKGGFWPRPATKAADTSRTLAASLVKSGTRSKISCNSGSESRKFASASTRANSCSAGRKTSCT